MRRNASANKYNGIEFKAASERVAAGKGDLTDPKQRITEAEAIEQAKQGDEAAFEILYQLHKRRVYSLCLRMVSNPSQAEDLAQEAFLQLFRKIGTFRGESAFSTWLHRMTVNVVLMQLRKKGLPVGVARRDVGSGRRGTAEGIRDEGSSS